MSELSKSLKENEPNNKKKGSDKSIVYLKDGNSHKAMPNGLRATLKGMKYFWFYKQPQEYRVSKRIEDFANEFQIKFKKVWEKYPPLRPKFRKEKGSNDKTENNEPDFEDLKKWFNKIESNGKAQTITILELIIYADVARVPLSVFLMFSKFVSEEHKRKNIDIQNSSCEIERAEIKASAKTYLEEEIKKYKEIVDYLEKIIIKNSEHSNLFFRVDHGHAGEDNIEHLGYMRLLNALSLIYNGEKETKEFFELDKMINDNYKSDLK